MLISCESFDLLSDHIQYLMLFFESVQVLHHDFRGAYGLVGLVSFFWLGRGRGGKERPFFYDGGFFVEDIFIRDF